MRYVNLGRSGLKVSAVCLGGNSWGAAGRRTWAPFGEAESRPFFKKALDLGINFFDTADAYNAGESETIMGNTLVGYARREELVIATKVSLAMGDKPNDAGVGRKHLMAGLDASLKRLRTDYIDLYIIHRLDGVTPLEETMSALNDMVRAGKVRYIGGSTMPAWRMAQMLMISDHKGYARFISMQNLYNAVQREEEREMHPLCVEQGVGLTPYSPLARGFLAANRTQGGVGATERAREDTIAQKNDLFRPADFKVADALAKIAQARGIKPTQAALAWLYAKPGMASPVIGTTQLHYLDDAAGAVDLKLTPEECKSVEEPYQWRAMGPG
ncbi:MAG: aldo/keto reductase [Alphaproteobacteria bacterium]|nr:aldo/keto reductase [Alphaproteobacteria bacterium]